jgi:hypothetical protein
MEMGMEMAFVIEMELELEEENNISKVILLDMFDWKIIENGFGYGDGEGYGVGLRECIDAGIGV